MQPWQLQLQQQRRSYIFFLPSDWAEFSFRWKLWWQDHTPTNIKIRLRGRYQFQKAKMKDRYSQEKAKLTANYQTRKSKAKDRYVAEKTKLKDRYQVQKAKFQSNYTSSKDQFQQRYQQRKVRSKEFTKRWSARRRDLVQDSSDMVKGYIQKRRHAKQQRQQQQQQDSSSFFHQFTITEYCQPHWFDPIDGRPLTSRDPAGRFVNPWQSWSANGVHAMSSILKWRYQRAVRQWEERGLMSLLPKDLPQLLFGSALVKTSRDAVRKNENATITTMLSSPTPSPDTIDFTWIGHSTCLVKMGHATILTDPIFSHRCTPLPRVPGVGVARDVPPSMALDDLPAQVDVCMISHDHFDHLDYLTVLHLRDRVQHWVLPKGLPEWLETRCSVDQEKMIELEWWESVHMVRQKPTPQSQSQAGDDCNDKSTSTDSPVWSVVPTLAPFLHAPGDGLRGQYDTMTITCCPAQHWSSRTFFDRCKRLWCGFAVETQTHLTNDDKQHQQQQEPVVQKFFFAGDTAMPSNGFPLFRQIGDFCGRGKYHRQPPMIHSSWDDPSALDKKYYSASDLNDHPAAGMGASSLSTSSKVHPFDLAAIPIGAYEPSFLMQEAHMDPMEAVECSRQLYARKSVAIHWGTFALSEEPMNEPPQKLQEALAAPENADVDFVTLPIGGSLRVPAIIQETYDDDSHADNDKQENEDDLEEPTEEMNASNYA